jgi:hypothetical protein
MVNTPSKTLNIKINKLSFVRGYFRVYSTGIRLILAFTVQGKPVISQTLLRTTTTTADPTL